MILRAFLALIACLLALLPPGTLASIPRNAFVPPPVALFGVEFSIEQVCGPLTLHLDGLHDRAGPCGGVLVRQNPWSSFDPEGLAGTETAIAASGPEGWVAAAIAYAIWKIYGPAIVQKVEHGAAVARMNMTAKEDQMEIANYRADHNGEDPPPGVMGNSPYRTGPPSKTAPQSGVSGSARETAKASNKAGATAPTVAQSSASDEKPATEAEAPKPEEKADAAESGKPKVKAKDRRAQQQAEAKEQKHGDSDYEEAAPEDYAKWKAKELEKAEGKDARRAAHDKKRDGIDRTKRQLDKDYEE